MRKTLIPWVTAFLAVCLGGQVWAVIGQAPRSLYLPGVYRFNSPSGLYGQMVQDGAPVGGLRIELARYTLGNPNSTTYFTSTLTSLDGRYGWSTLPSLGANQAYFVRWINPSQTYEDRAYAVFSGDLTTYTSTAPAQFATLDIADIVLTGPTLQPGGLRLPVTLTWTPRLAAPTDRYRVRFFSADFTSLLSITPDLGYAGSYTLTALPEGLSPAVDYQWDVIAEGPDGALVVPWTPLFIRFSP